jgi:hypothetical protein
MQKEAKSLQMDNNLQGYSQLMAEIDEKEEEKKSF